MIGQRQYFVKQLNKHIYEGIVVVLITLVAVYGGWLYRNFAQDDAFITYRYARNLVNGAGFVYNLNEPILGTTTPLYTLVLALAGKLSGLDMRWLSHFISILSLWVSGVVLFFLGRESDLLLAAMVALVFSSNPLLLTAVGMETFFLLAIMLLLLQSYITDKFSMAGVWLGLLILTRYEMALFAAILGVHFLVKRRRFPLWLVSTAVMVLVWLAYAWVTFGHVIPRSAVAKLVEDEGFSFALGALLWWRVYVLENGWYYLFIPLVLLGLTAIFRGKAPGTVYQLLLVWSLVYFVAAGAIAGTFSWYYGPLIPGLAILLVWGADWLARLVGRWSGQQPALRVGVLAVLTGGVVLLQLSSWDQGWVNYHDQIIDPRTVHYRKVAQWLNQHASDGVSLASSEIGVLGYYTNGVQIVDLYGLVTPGLIPWLTADRVQMLDKAMELYAPDYLLINESELNEFLRHSASYEPVEQFDAGTYTLYKKR